MKFWSSCIVLFLWAIVSQAQISAIKLTAEDTSNTVWINTTGFADAKNTFQILGAVEVPLQFNGGVYSNNLLGFQYQKKHKNIAVQIAPYFFVSNEIGSRFPVPTDVRVGNLTTKSNGYSYKVDALANLVWKPFKYINLAVGKGNHQLGKGVQSLLWSGNGAPAYFGLAELTTAKLSYRVQWNAISLVDNNNLKWIAQHTATIHLPKKWQISLYEAVIWGAKDSVYSRGFDWQYIAPTVIYRPTEFNGGSADNVILGLNWSGKLFKQINTYGQVVVDEFLLDEIRKNDGWWANKFGIQLGLSRQSKRHFMQAEFNAVRPFTYSHGNTVIAYTNQAVPLGPWDGAGFAQILGTYKYYLSEKTSLAFFGAMGTYKTIFNGNYGGNPFKSYNSRAGERNHMIGGTNSYNRLDLSVSVTYLVLPSVSGLLTFWAGMQLNPENDFGSSWLQIKLSNTLFSKFYKTNFN